MLSANNIEKLLRNFQHSTKTKNATIKYSKNNFTKNFQTSKILITRS